MITALVMGNMIGSGVFLLPATLAVYGKYALVGWFISAVGAMLLAYVFARLSFHIPQQGGIYAFSRKAFGDYVGFQVAWIYWIQTWIGNAALVLGAVAYLASLWPELRHDTTLALMVAQVILWTITGINLLSLRVIGAFQTVMTVLKVLPILLIAIVGFFYISPDRLAAAPVVDGGQDIPDIINKVVLLTMWTFIGVESAGVPAGGIKNPRRTIPLATLVGTGLTAVLYLMGMAAVMGVVPQSELLSTTAPFAVAAVHIFGDTLGPVFFWVVALGAIISSIGALNGWVLMQGQMPMAAAENGLFPALFKRTNSQGVPYLGVLLSSSLIAIFLIIGMQEGLVALFEKTITLATLGILICYLFAVVSQFVLVRKGSIHGSDITLGDKILFVPAFCYVLYALHGVGEALLALGALFFFASTPLYALVVKRVGRGEADAQGKAPSNEGAITMGGAMSDADR